MHELVVTESILEIALRNAEQAGAEQITDIYLVIGELSSIVDDSVSFYWGIISEGTAAAGSSLHFNRIPAEFSCQDCDHRFGLQENFLCPSCDSSQITITAGREFFLESLEVVERQPELTTSAEEQPVNELEDIALDGVPE
jgi:hydrogenase nickel incorporation protein HypA/HybF